jgi:signal transduction histidine kinase
MSTIILFGAILTGLCWTMCIVWFLLPSQPVSVLIISIALIIEILGGLLTWFCYLPAVIAISLPPVMPLVTLLFFEGGPFYLVTCLMLSLLTVLAIVSSRKLTGMLDHTLYLNFENAKLRQESEEKSHLLEIALEETLQREQALEMARKEAEQANAAKTRFLAAASHDLRQPIHALGLFFSELSHRIRSPQTDPVIGHIDDAILAINTMLNTLLDVSKLDAGVVVPTLEPVCLKGLFYRLEQEFSPIALKRRNTLHTLANQTKVITDLAMLERMLRNLIGNALRYTQNGQVVVTAKQRGDNVHIRVLDNGIGIPRDQHEEIFVEFHQLQNPARDREQGLGLGLAIVKRLAKLLRHDVKVASRVGRGSCFSIILPAAQLGVNAQARYVSEIEVSVQDDALADVHVLVLDDDNAILQSTHNLLRRWGCQVTAVGSYAQAMEKLATVGQAWHVLVVDYRLPGDLSGIDVARNLVVQLGHPVPVLIITGDTGPERLQEADRSGYLLCAPSMGAM